MSKYFFISAKFLQEKNNETIGFKISERTSIEVTEESRFWWLMGNLLRWHILARVSTGKCFELSRNVQIIFTKEKAISPPEIRYLTFRRSKSQSLKTFDFENYNYTIIDIETGSHSLFRSPTKLVSYNDSIKYSNSLNYKTIGPVIYTPMRD